MFSTTLPRVRPTTSKCLARSDKSDGRAERAVFALLEGLAAQAQRVAIGFGWKALREAPTGALQHARYTQLANLVKSTIL